MSITASLNDQVGVFLTAAMIGGDQINNMYLFERQDVTFAINY